MTDSEFATRQKELLRDLPEEFHGPLSQMAYERGHSSGYEEVLGILQSLVSDLKDPIEKYGQSFRQ